MYKIKTTRELYAAIRTCAETEGITIGQTYSDSRKTCQRVKFTIWTHTNVSIARLKKKVEKLVNCFDGFQSFEFDSYENHISQRRYTRLILRIDRDSIMEPRNNRYYDHNLNKYVKKK